MYIKKLEVEDNQNKIVKLLNQQLKERIDLDYLVTSDYSIAIFADNDVYLGGLIARRLGNTLHISLLAVNLENRKSGLGSQLMNAVEQYALAEGITKLTVNTQDYQAVDFYKRFNFTIFGSLPDSPFEGTTKYYLFKNI